MPPSCPKSSIGLLFQQMANGYLSPFNVTLFLKDFAPSISTSSAYLNKCRHLFFILGKHYFALPLFSNRVVVVLQSCRFCFSISEGFLIPKDNERFLKAPQWLMFGLFQSELVGSRF